MFTFCIFSYVFVYSPSFSDRSAMSTEERINQEFLVQWRKTMFKAR